MDYDHQAESAWAIERDELRAENERLRTAIKDALQSLALEDNLGFATRELERALEQKES